MPLSSPQQTARGVVEKHQHLSGTESPSCVAERPFTRHYVRPDQVKKSPSPLVSENIEKIIEGLKDNRIEADFWTSLPNADHELGIACYIHNQPDFQLKVVFQLPPRWQEKVKETIDKLPAIEGKLAIDENRKKYFLQQYRRKRFFPHSHLQSTRKTPFSFVPDTVRFKTIDIQLDDTQRIIFNHIRSLSGTKVSAELLKVDFGKSLGIAWYSFTIAQKVYGTPVACQIIRLPGYQNKDSQIFTTSSTSLRYTVTGIIRFETLRLYRSIQKYCPVFYIKRTTDSPDGLPVFMQKESIKIEQQ